MYQNLIISIVMERIFLHTFYKKKKKTLNKTKRID